MIKRLVIRVRKELFTVFGSYHKTRAEELLREVVRLESELLEEQKEHRQALAELRVALDAIQRDAQLQKLVSSVGIDGVVLPLRSSVHAAADAKANMLDVLEQTAAEQGAPICICETRTSRSRLYRYPNAACPMHRP